MLDLQAASEEAATANVVIWMANIPNEHPKNCVRSIKVVNPTCVLVTSKRAVEKNYALPSVIQHALALHSNLVVLFTPHPTQPQGRYRAQLLDPLGNLYSTASDFEGFKELGTALSLRVSYLSSLRRKGSEKAIGSCPETQPDEPEFLELVRESAETFGKMLPAPDSTSRFVGNAAFRCSHGFPALRNNQTIYVSRRNVDKRTIGMDAFVPIIGESGDKLLYCGSYKPSVDAPIQRCLFGLYHNIKYMLHGHVYLRDAPKTTTVLPCGALREVTEIWQHFPEHDREAVAINLNGHGFVAGAASVEGLKRVMLPFVERPFPEDQSSWINDRLNEARSNV